MGRACLVCSREHLGGVDEDLEIGDFEVAHADTFGESLGFEFLHDRPSGRNVWLGVAGSMNKVQVDILHTQLQPHNFVSRISNVPAKCIRTLLKLA